VGDTVERTGHGWHGHGWYGKIFLTILNIIQFYMFLKNPNQAQRNVNFILLFHNEIINLNKVIAG
jgi:hypothetical protein